MGQFQLINFLFCPWEALYGTVLADWVPVLTARGALWDSSCWLSPRFDRDSRSIGQFQLINFLFCPWDALYWTVLADRLPVLTARGALWDSSCWLSLHFDRDSLLYWTVLADCLPVLTVRRALLDSSHRTTPRFDRDNRSIGQFLLNAILFCPIESLETTAKVWNNSSCHHV